MCDISETCFKEGKKKKKSCIQVNNSWLSNHHIFVVKIDYLVSDKLIIQHNSGNSKSTSSDLGDN